MRVVTDGPLRPARRGPAPLRKKVAADIAAVRRGGDAALTRLGGGGAPLVVPRKEQKRAFGRLGPRLRSGLEVACRHTGALARRQLAARKTFDLRPSAGLSIYHRHVALGGVGVLVPSGRVSVLLSAAIPAAVAGVGQRVVCSAPGPDGRLPDAVLAAAFMCDVTTLCAAGGPAAVAALAYGTESVDPVDRILGIGAGEELGAASLVSGRCDVRLRAPPDLLVVADRTASAEFVAADLLAHAESAPQADGLLLTTDRALADQVAALVRKWARALESADPIRSALRRARARVAAGAPEAISLANAYAPGRLSLVVKRPGDWLGGLRSYGALLLGSHTPPALAELATGGSVLLPAGARARAEQAGSVEDFARAVDTQLVDPSAYARLARVGDGLAEVEGRTYARRAISVRLEARKD